VLSLTLFTHAANSQELFYSRCLLSDGTNIVERLSKYCNNSPVHSLTRIYFVYESKADDIMFVEYERISNNLNHNGSNKFVCNVTLDTFCSIVHEFPLSLITSVFIFVDVPKVSLVEALKLYSIKLNPGHQLGREHLSTLEFRLSGLLEKLGYTLSDINAGARKNYMLKLRF